MEKTHLHIEALVRHYIFFRQLRLETLGLMVSLPGSMWVAGVAPETVNCFLVSIRHRYNLVL